MIVAALLVHWPFRGGGGARPETAVPGSFLEAFMERPVDERLQDAERKAPGEH